MAALTGNSIASTYTQLLKITSASLGADASAKYIEDGAGTDSALSLSTTRVGIGTSSPGALFHTYRDTSDTTASIIIEEDGTGDPTLKFLTTGVQDWSIGIDNSDSDTFKIGRGSDSVSGNSKLVLDNNSRISLSNNAFSGDSNNTTFGAGCGEDLASGATFNCFMGHQAGKEEDEGDHNTAFGSTAYAANGTHTASSYNTCIGSASGHNMGTGGAAERNTAVGYASLTALTTADDNVAIGANSADAITTGGENIAIGTAAAGALTTGTGNVCVGYAAMTAANATEATNIAIGRYAMSAMDEGENAGSDTVSADNNIAIGLQALNGGDMGDASSSDGSNRNFDGNIAIGAYALDATSTHPHTGSIAIGHQALTSCTSGGSNTAIGYQSGYLTDVNYSNVFIGYTAGYAADNATTAANENVYIGAQSGKNLDDGANNVAVGYQAMARVDAGTGNNATNSVGIGWKALSQIIDGDYNVAVGANAADNMTTGDYNVAVGDNALGGVTTSGVQGCVAIGASALAAAHTRSATIMIGHNAGALLTTGDHNIGIGYNALATHVDGSKNICIGYGAMQDTNAGSDSDTSAENVFIGHLAGGGTWANAVSSFNVGVGCNVMDAALDGALKNTAVGHGAGTAIEEGSQNTLLGFQAGIGIVDADWNTCVGDRAGDSITSGQANTVIGVTADCAATVSNQIAIGNGSVTTAQFGIAIGDQVSAGGNDAVMGKSGAIITVDFDADGTWTQSSDIRKKRNIKDDSLGLSFINDLKTKTFQWKSAEEHPEEWGHFRIDEDGNKVYSDINTDVVMHGMIAQEVKESLDKAGCDTFGGWKVDDNGQQELSKAMFVIPLIKSVQELSKKVEELEAKLSE